MVIGQQISIKRSPSSSANNSLIAFLLTTIDNVTYFYQVLFVFAQFWHLWTFLSIWTITSLQTNRAYPFHVIAFYSVSKAIESNVWFRQPITYWSSPNSVLCRWFLLTYFYYHYRNTCYEWTEMEPRLPTSAKRIMHHHFNSSKKLY